MPYLGEERKIKVTKELFMKFLEVGNFTFEEFRTQFKTGQFEIRGQGSAVIIYDESYATIWIGVNNVNLMIGREEINSFKFLMQ